VASCETNAASRAVGAANGSNPIAIKCALTIASSAASGNLTRYGGGLPRKQWLLAHERGK
jgi:methylated-DNA-[protein]-cysteine S-methyltransferase